MKVTGIITVIGETETFGSNGFQVRKFAIQTEDQYPQDIELQVVQDKVNLLDGLNINDKVDCSINLRGRKWTNKEGKDMYFNTIQAWKIEKLSGAPSQPEPVEPPPF